MKTWVLVTKAVMQVIFTISLIFFLAVILVDYILPPFPSGRIRHTPHQLVAYDGNADELDGQVNLTRQDRKIKRYSWVKYDGDCFGDKVDCINAKIELFEDVKFHLWLHRESAYRWAGKDKGKDFSVFGTKGYFLLSVEEKDKVIYLIGYKQGRYFAIELE